MLSHPMIVEAAGSLFVPVVVHNNSKDPGDLAALKAFDEPAWNNPVVRVIDAERRDLAPRVDRWTLAPLTAAMRAALGAEHTPAWLAAFDDEVAAHEAGLETAIFGMS